MMHSDYIALGTLPTLHKSRSTIPHFNRPTTDDSVTSHMQLTKLQRWRFNLINMYLTDALNTRAPNKILESRSQTRSTYTISIHTAYKMSHNSLWSLFVYVTIWMHLGMIFYEPWANIDITHEYQSYLYLIEGVILLIYVIDVYLHYISHDKQNYWNLIWAKLIVVCIVLNYIDIIASLVIHTYLIRIGSILRPIFLITRSQFLRATCVSIFNSIPNIVDVLLLVCFYILVFAVLGYVLFSQQQMGIGVHVSEPNTVCDAEAVSAQVFDTDCDLIQDAGNIHFDTLYNSYLSLCVLMSTANFPDVMMSSFHSNKTSALFFVAFIAFGIYYSMSIMFAVIYHHYHTDNARFVRILTNNRAKALDAAFKQMIILSKELESPSPQLQLKFNEERIYFSVFREYLQFRRRDLNIGEARILYNALCEARSKTEAVKLVEDEGNGITRAQWQNLYKFINVKIFRNPSYAVEYMIKKEKNKILLSLIIGDEDMYSIERGCCQRLFIKKENLNYRVIGDRQQCDCCFELNRQISLQWLRFRTLLYRMFTHEIISKVIDLLIWIGTLILIYEIQLKQYNVMLEHIYDMLIYVFLAEVTLRLIAFGSFFFADSLNIIDFIVVYASMIFDIFDMFDSKGIVAFRLLRFVRALHSIERFKLIISTSITVLKKVGVLFSLEFCVLYVFAVIGVYCYSGVVTKESTLQMYRDAMERNDVDDIWFWQYIRDNYYYDNNMNYVFNALMVMMELTVVNQWHVITRMYRELTSPVVYLYFYAFYFISVLIVTNVLTAFIFDAFIIQFQSVRTQQIERKKEKARHYAIERKQERQKQKRIRHNRNVLSHTGIQLTDYTRDRKHAIGHTAHVMSLSSEDSLFMDRNSNSKKDDALDEYLTELNASDKDDWHKWMAIAMLYEFDTDDVIKGVWLYDRDKTKADFYEQIYGEVNVAFDEYLKAWNESVPVPDAYVDDHSDIAFHHSMNGVAVDAPYSFHSKTDSIRGSGKDIIITRETIKKNTILDTQTRATVLSVKDSYGNIDRVNIKGPKQKSVFLALSTAPQIGFAPKIIDKKQASKASKLLDFYVPPES